MSVPIVNRINSEAPLGVFFDVLTIKPYTVLNKSAWDKSACNHDCEPFYNK